MADVIAHFVKPLPWRVVLKGEPWRIAVCPQNKSGKRVAICAWVDQRSVDKSYTLWSGHVGELYGKLVDGIPIASATPQRGLVTELRRAGLMHLRPAPKRPVSGLETNPIAQTPR
jgi:hypothetical protein